MSEFTVWTRLEWKEKRYYPKVMVFNSREEAEKFADLVEELVNFAVLTRKKLSFVVHEEK